jgi:hypothetical protein
MPEQANMCSMLVELNREVVVWKHDDTIEKDDVCNMVKARVVQIVRQLIATPYANNLCFDLDKPPELDQFDRAALHQMEMSDDVQ